MKTLKTPSKVPYFMAQKMATSQCDFHIITLIITYIQTLAPPAPSYLRRKEWTFFYSFYSFVIFVSKLTVTFGTIHVKHQQIFTIFDPYSVDSIKRTILLKVLLQKIFFSLY